MVQMIIDKYGRSAIAAIAAAYRDGAGDAEALEAGTGVPADQLYETYFASFGGAAPTAVEPAPILPSDVDKPPQPAAPVGESATPAPTPVEEPVESGGDAGWLPAVILAGFALGAVIAVFVIRRRRTGTQ